MKKFVKGQLVRSVSHNVIARIEHLGYQGDIALVRKPDGPTTCFTWSSWLPLKDLRHVSAVELLAQVVDESR